MKEKSIFSKIIAKDIPAKIIFEDEFSILIEDISPQAPIHYLAIPKKEIVGISDMSTDDKELIGQLMLMIKEQMTKKGINDYRLVINNGSEAGQTVFHLHIHVLADRTLAWPPG